MVIENFKQAYAIARNNRHHRLWAGEFIRFPGAAVFISGISGILLIGRDPIANCSAYFHTVGQSGHSKEFRRLRIKHSRETGPVPLP